MLNIFRVLLDNYADDNEDGKSACDSDISLDAERFSCVRFSAADVATLRTNGTLTIGDETFVNEDIDRTELERYWRQMEREGR